MVKTVAGQSADLLSGNSLCASPDLKYDGFGNIENKNGVAYAYSGTNAGPHAVTSVGGATYTYDANGNAETGDGRTFVYTSYDMVSRISKFPHDSYYTEFKYGPERARWQRVDLKSGVTTTTTYLGNVERIVSSSKPSEIEWKRSVAGVLFTYKTNTSNQIQSTDKRFVFTDHLGSVDVITDAAGVIRHSLSFDAWGARRNGENWTAQDVSQIIASLSLTGFTQPITTCGYTGHEMVDDMDIIHMNGRIYDAKIARFLQADPVVDGVTNTQGYNRYSYLHNNPLNATDPSGFSSWTKFRDKWLKPIAAIALTVATYGAASAWAVGMYGASCAVACSLATANIIGGIVSGAAAGFVGRASMSAFSGASVKDSFKAGFKGAAAGALMGGVGGYYGNTYSWSRVAADGIAGGLSSEIYGGSFKKGFRMSASLSLITFANYKMRQSVSKQSKLNPDNIGKESDGMFGDGEGLAGTRRVPNPKFGTDARELKYLACDGPAGGCQGAVLQSNDRASHLSIFDYGKGDVLDKVAESFAGPHDWLSDQVGMYDPLTGNGIYRTGFSNFAYETMSYGLIPVAAPFSAAALISTTPGLTIGLWGGYYNGQTPYAQ